MDLTDFLGAASVLYCIPWGMESLYSSDIGNT